MSRNPRCLYDNSFQAFLHDTEMSVLQPKGSPVTWLCGLYRIEEGLPCYVILTREPSEEIRFIHDRMPLMLPDQCIDEWINPNANPAEMIQKAQTDILYERVS